MRQQGLAAKHGYLTAARIRPSSIVEKYSVFLLAILCRFTRASYFCRPICKIEVEMNAFAAYSIPIQGLKFGIHHFKFTIDGAFFRHFEDSPVEEGEIQFELQLDKRPDMFILDFELEGYVKAECDRCTAVIDLPLKDARELIVKYGEPEDAVEEDEVVFISRDVSVFNVAKYLYEFTVLALPITNTYDCQSDANPPCNFEVLKYLSNDTDAQKPDSVWDALKGINDN